MTLEMLTSATTTARANPPHRPLGTSWRKAGVVLRTPGLHASACCPHDRAASHATRTPDARDLSEPHLRLTLRREDAPASPSRSGLQHLHGGHVASRSCRQEVLADKSRARSLLRQCDGQSRLLLQFLLAILASTLGTSLFALFSKRF